MAGLRGLRIVSRAAYVVAGVGVWLATHSSGVHATVAGVGLGLLAPARLLTPAAQVAGAGPSVSVAERLEHRPHPWTRLVVLPFYALANAGVQITARSRDSPAAVRAAVGVVGVVVALVAGKLLGMRGASWLAVRRGLGRLPAGATPRMFAGVAALGGMGFTVSPPVAERAYPPGPVRDAAKVGVLAASALAALLGAAVLWATTRGAPDDGRLARHRRGNQRDQGRTGRRSRRADRPGRGLDALGARPAGPGRGRGRRPACRRPSGGGPARPQPRGRCRGHGRERGGLRPLGRPATPVIGWHDPRGEDAVTRLHAAFGPEYDRWIGQAARCVPPWPSWRGWSSTAPT